MVGSFPVDNQAAAAGWGGPRASDLEGLSEALDASSVSSIEVSVPKLTRSMSQASLFSQQDTASRIEDAFVKGRAALEKVQRSSLSNEGALYAFLLDINADNISLTPSLQEKLLDASVVLENIDAFLEAASAMEPHAYMEAIAPSVLLLTELVGELKEAGVDEGANMFAAVADVLRNAMQKTNLTDYQAPFSVKSIKDFHQNIAQAAIQTAHKLDITQEQLGDIIAAVKNDVARFEGEEYQSGKVNLPSHVARKLMGGRTVANTVQKLLKAKQVIKAAKTIKTFKRAGERGLPIPTKLGHAHKEMALAAYMKGAIKRTGGTPPSVRDIAKMIHQEYTQNLNHLPWPVIERKGIDISCQGRVGEARSKLTPCALISPELRQKYGTLGGISSLSNKEASHAVNFWKTEYEDTNGPFSFSGYRHGIHDAYRLKGEERSQAADNRVAEAVQAMAQGSPHLLSRNEDGTYNMDVVSVSLLTPGLGGGEQKMLKNQMGAYEKANGKTFTIPNVMVDGRVQDIQVKPNFLGVNYGVNAVAFSNVSLLDGWNNAERQNYETLTKLVGSPDEEGLGGMAREAVLKAETAGDIPKANLIRSLVQQIKTIHNAPQGSPFSARSQGREPYKMATRVAALANEMGVITSFNCKSGKDRTGQLDLEVKDLYRHINATGEMRPLDNVRTPEEVAVFKTLAQEAGARELQVLNTGLPGTKGQLDTTYLALGFEKGKNDELKDLSAWISS